MKIREIELRQLRMPLRVPYVVSTRTITEFDPIVVCAIADDGTEGWGEALISPGYTYETREGAWSFCREAAQRMRGSPLPRARAAIADQMAASPGAASALLAALDMLDDHPLLHATEGRRIPLLAPVQGHAPAEIQDDVARLIEHGFRTLKVKVGFDWRADLERVSLIQTAAQGRATLRLDANRSYRREDAIAFARGLQPEGIELFEQPCGSAAWEDNAAVAARSNVPIMLDESIYSMDDVRRAAGIEGVDFIKLKLKKIGSIDMLCDGLAEIRRLGMTPVLGDGMSTEIGCWMEACVASCAIDNAGEMNGFLKTKDRLFVDALKFADGAVTIPRDYRPRINRDAVDFHTTHIEKT